MLSDATLGSLVRLIGYAPAQMVTRLLTIVGYMIALPALFSVFALSALDAALARRQGSDDHRGAVETDCSRRLTTTSQRVDSGRRRVVTNAP